MNMLSQLLFVYFFMFVFRRPNIFAKTIHLAIGRNVWSDTQEADQVARKTPMSETRVTNNLPLQTSHVLLNYMCK